MPTLISRPSVPFLALFVALAVPAQNIHAQDLHIKKSITAGGNFVSSSETSIKGARERTVSQQPTGTVITLHQCDLHRTLTINEQAQTYLVVNDAPDDAALKAAAMMSGAPAADSGAYITETASVTDTGERKTLYGYQARHLKSKVSVVSSQNSCSQLNQQYEVDGWYADISKEMSGACQQFLPPVRQPEGCSDRVIRKRSGSAKPGYPIQENLTLHSADGSTQQVGVITSEISKPTLEKALFDVPAGYREVKTSAELNGTPAPAQQVAQAPQPAGSTPPAQQALAQQSAQNSSALKKSMVAGMFNPAAAKGAQQNANAMATSQMGMYNNAMGTPGANGMPGGTGPTAAAGTAPLGPKKTGHIRIGIAPPDAQVGQGNNTGGDYSTPIRNAEVTLMSGPAVEIAPLDAHIPIQLQAEAQQKQCDYVMYSSVVVKHQQGGFGKFAKFGGMAASMTPMGMMAHGMAGAAAAQAAGMAASQMAQQQAMNQLASFNGQIKNKDDVTVQYQLVAPGQTTPVVQNTLQGKAKSDGEDVLTPLLTQAATSVLTQVSTPQPQAQAAAQPQAQAQPAQKK
ncbi:MAG TPA: hypothetical protein VGG04_11840 [Candidatus Sulfotelmatobacter sp.]